MFKVNNKDIRTASMANFMAPQKQHVLIKTFFKILQINDFLPIWICHNRLLNHNIGHIHKRILRIAYEDNKTLN